MGEMAFLHEHALADAVRARVLAELAAIERRHRVRVIYACESGSRGWGFASPDSDYDVRFLYVHEPDWYLRVEAGRDSIELPISDELDIAGWELRKALRLLRRSNPTLFEWLDSPLVYREDAALAARLRALAPGFHAGLKGRWHYLALARKTFDHHLQGERVAPKKYLYALRPLLAVRWLDAGRGVPPMRFADLAAATVREAALAEEINALLALKMASGEAVCGERFPRLHAWIEAALAEAAPAAGWRTPEGDPAALDRLLYDAVRGVGEASWR